MSKKLYEIHEKTLVFVAISWFLGNISINRRLYTCCGSISMENVRISACYHDISMRTSPVTKHIRQTALELISHSVLLMQESPKLFQKLRYWSKLTHNSSKIKNGLIRKRINQTKWFNHVHSNYHNSRTCLVAEVYEYWISAAFRLMQFTTVQFQILAITFSYKFEEGNKAKQNIQQRWK